MSDRIESVVNDLELRERPEPRDGFECDVLAVHKVFDTVHLLLEFSQTRLDGFIDAGQPKSSARLVRRIYWAGGNIFRKLQSTSGASDSVKFSSAEYHSDRFRHTWRPFRSITTRALLGALIWKTPSMISVVSWTAMSGFWSSYLLHYTARKLSEGI